VKKYLATLTTKQKGDAGEFLVAAELTLAGIPALKVPDNWPGYDVIAHPPGRDLQKISVKTRTFKRSSSDFVSYHVKDNFDWLAIVLLPGQSEARRRIFVVPRIVADASARRDRESSKAANDRYWPIHVIAELFRMYENNFLLLDEGKQ